MSSCIASHRPRGLYFSDFRALLERNKTPTAQIAFFSQPRKRIAQISVLDRDLPRRKGWDVQDEPHTIHSYEEAHFIESHVCDMGLFNGMVLMEGVKGEREHDWQGNMGWKEKPVRGVLAVVQLLCNEGSLRRTDELKRLLECYGRRLT